MSQVDSRGPAIDDKCSRNGKDANDGKRQRLPELPCSCLPLAGKQLFEAVKPLKKLVDVFHLAAWMIRSGQMITVEIDRIDGDAS